MIAKQILGTLAIAGSLSAPLIAQTATDSAHLRAVHARLAQIAVYEDSLFTETCRGGTLSATLATCRGAKQGIRLTAVRRFTQAIRIRRAAIDSIERAHVGTPTSPPPDTQPTPPDTTPTPIPPDTTSPTPPPDFTSLPSPVTLPRVWLSWARPIATRTITIPAGGNLQTALNAARGENVDIVLSAGATYRGNFTASSCGAGWIVVRGATLPPWQQRMTPSLARTLNAPQIITPNTQPALLVAPTSCRWALVGVEVSIDSAVTAANYGLVRMEGSENVLDADFIHGRTTSRIVRCVTTNGAIQQVLNSWLSDCHASGQDAQAIAGWNGPGPYRIVGNYLEGSGENILFGGADPTVPQLIPADIEIRRNHINKPDWYNGRWDNKNLIETKNATRVLIESNVLEGSWSRHGQDNAVIFKSANQSGGCAWCRTTDVTFRLNALSRNTTGVAVAGLGYTGPNDSLTRRIAIMDNVIEAGTEGGNRWGILLTGGLYQKEPTIERNLIIGPVSTSLYLDGGAGGCTIRDNVLSKGQYGGVFGRGGGTVSQLLDRFCAPWTFERNTIIGSASTSYPPGTVFAATEGAVPLATLIRARVDSATRGVVIPPQ